MGKTKNKDKIKQKAKGKADTTVVAAGPTSSTLVVSLLSTAVSLQRRLDGGLSVIKGITYSEYLLLSSLGATREATATRVDLAAAVGLSPSGVTRALKPLERLGFVVSTRDTRDARRSLATLTPQGFELVADAAGVVEDVIGDLPAIASLTPAERTSFLTLLNALHGS